MSGFSNSPRLQQGGTHRFVSTGLSAFQVLGTAVPDFSVIALESPAAVNLVAKWRRRFMDGGYVATDSK
ncbi:MAG: hypothetical protein P8L85_08035 [Rubripirellula sp.]|nr:hypothetical protein [Rubripirellula sp.]